MAFIHICGYFSATLLMVISTVIFIYLLIAYFPHIRTFFYKKGECLVTGTIYKVQYACICGEDCKSFYPCMLVYAKVNGSQVLIPESNWPVIVFDDDWQQLWINAAETDLEERCSLRVCHPSIQENRDEVERYRQEYGLPGMRLPCFYDGNNIASKGVVLNQNIPWSLAFHVIFWPSLCFFIAILICTILCYQKKHNKKRYSSVSVENEEKT